VTELDDKERQWQVQKQMQPQFTMNNTMKAALATLKARPDILYVVPAKMDPDTLELNGVKLHEILQIHQVGLMEF
jgi:hypothetical protein